MQTPEISICPLTDADRDWVKQFVFQHWGATIVIGHGVTYTLHELPGFVADVEGEHVGLITYSLQGQECEVVSIDSTRSGIGIGTSLIETIKRTARQLGCKRLWLITTNDNMNALRFYQKRGFVLVAVHRDAVTQSRKLKPEIPLLGDDDIPLRDEIELELLLDSEQE
jgi:GNAT superfamily N-acetyltransferase